MICKVFSANEWLYPDTDISTGESQIKLISAKQGFACCQIMIQADAEEIDLVWDTTQSDFLPPEVFKLHSVYVGLNTAENGFTMKRGMQADHYTRQAPFWVYDAMEPIDNKAVKKEKSGLIALYLKWSIKNMNAGVYKAKLQVNTEVLPVQITVYDVTIPQKEKLRLTNWFSIENIATSHRVEMWSDKHWELIEEYAKIMRYTRQTDFRFPISSIEVQKNYDGKYLFDFSRLERFIKLFLSLGFRYIESPTLIHRVTWEGNEVVIDILGKRVSVFTDEAYSYLQGYFTGLYQLYKQNGWLNIVAQHVFDEPHENCVWEYKALSGMVRKWMPGIKIIEAVTVPNLDGAVDIWVPMIHKLSENYNDYDRKRINGDDLWFYTCCVPGGKHLNRLLDQELLRTRYLHWINRLYDLKGYLHWGLNRWRKGTDPFRFGDEKIVTLNENPLPCGDTHIVYPGNSMPWGSVRLEMMRAGCEDYELLEMLASIDEEKTGLIVSKCVRSFTDYTTDVSVFEKVYEELLKSLS